MIVVTLPVAASFAFALVCIGLLVLGGSFLFFAKARKEDELATSIRVERLLQEMRITAITKMSSQVPPPPPPPPNRQGRSSRNFSIIKGPTNGNS